MAPTNKYPFGIAFFFVKRFKGIIRRSIKRSKVKNWKKCTIAKVSIVFPIGVSPCLLTVQL